MGWQCSSADCKPAIEIEIMKEKVKYIYISNLSFDGTVFVTQVLDWLHLYRDAGIHFDLFVVYPIKTILKRSNTIKKNIILFYIALFKFLWK